MKEFSTALLRERFVIYDPQKGKGTPENQTAVIALSNRIVVDLHNVHGTLIETFIVRAHTMHMAVRMAAKILQSFTQGGPILVRSPKFSWENAYTSILGEYERTYNPQCWMAIYNKGKCIFGEGERHPLLDMIEKCDHENDRDYDFAVPIAENLFLQAGKNLKIEHDANVALSVYFKGAEGRCGIILRNPHRTTTFTFKVHSAGEKPLNIPQALICAAAFLEGVQLSFLLGMNTEKIRIGLIKRRSKEEKQTIEGRRRLARLTSEIAALESAFTVRYRPEKPEFADIMIDAENLAQKILVPPPEEEETDAPETDETPEKDTEYTQKEE